MEREVAVREWCIDRAIQMNHGIGNSGRILKTARLLEEYLAGNIEIKLESFDGFNIKCKR